MLLKQIACGRRKPNMTRKEYFDHRFRIHGSITDGVEDLDIKPHKYIQTQIFDSASGSRKDGPLNANQYWCGRDDVSELYFRDWDHLISTFNSSYVKETIGPDGPLFADFETSMALLAWEKSLALNTELQSEMAHNTFEEGYRTVAMFFISTSDNNAEGEQLEKVLSPALISELEKHARNETWGLLVNVGIVSTKFDLQAYFGGSNMPQYALVYKIFLKDNRSVTAVRKAQAAFAETAGQEFDLHNSFIVFGREGLVMDMNRGERFEPSRQPLFMDLLGPSHLQMSGK